MKFFGHVLDLILLKNPSMERNSLPGSLLLHVLESTEVLPHCLEGSVESTRGLSGWRQSRSGFICRLISNQVDVMAGYGEGFFL